MNYTIDKFKYFSIKNSIISEQQKIVKGCNKFDIKIWISSTDYSDIDGIFIFNDKEIALKGSKKNIKFTNLPLGVDFNFKIITKENKELILTWQIYKDGIDDLNLLFQPYSDEIFIKCKRNEKFIVPYSHIPMDWIPSILVLSFAKYDDEKLYGVVDFEGIEKKIDGWYKELRFKLNDFQAFINQEKFIEFTLKDVEKRKLVVKYWFDD